jgi:hypothetical protein
MSAIAPVAASSFAPEERLRQHRAGMAFVGAWVERRRMTRIARAASGLGLLGRVAVLRTPL